MTPKDPGSNNKPGALRGKRRATLANLARVGHPAASRTSPASGRGFSLNRACGSADYVEDAFGLGEHRYMAAVEFVGSCIHALGNEALHVGMDGAIVLTDDVPTGL